jgi:hypothetical protein
MYNNFVLYIYLQQPARSTLLSLLTLKEINDHLTMASYIRARHKFKVPLRWKAKLEIRMFISHSWRREKLRFDLLCIPCPFDLIRDYVNWEVKTFVLVELECVW